MKSKEACTSRRGGWCDRFFSAVAIDSALSTLDNGKGDAKVQHQPFSEGCSRPDLLVLLVPQSRFGDTLLKI